MKKCSISSEHERMKEFWFEKCIWCWLKLWPSFQEKMTQLYKETITEEMEKVFLKAMWNGKNIWEAIQVAQIPDWEYQMLMCLRIIKKFTKTIKYIDTWNNIIS